VEQKKRIAAAIHPELKHPVTLSELIHNLTGNLPKKAELA